MAEAEEELKGKLMIAYKTAMWYQGAKDVNGEEVALELGLAESTVDRIFCVANRVENPILEVVCWKAFETKCTKSELLTQINKVIVEIDGSAKDTIEDPGSDETSPFNIDESAKLIYLHDKLTQGRVFRKVTARCSNEARYIAHFLDSHDNVQSAFVDNPDNNKKRLNTVLKSWIENQTKDGMAWLKLRAVLMFLKKDNVVEDIEKGQAQPSPVKRSERCNVYKSVRGNWVVEVMMCEDATDIQIMRGESKEMICIDHVEKPQEGNKFNFVLHSDCEDIEDLKLQYKVNGMVVEPIEILIASIHKYERRQFSVVSHGSTAISQDIEEIINAETVESAIKFVVGGEAQEKSPGEYRDFRRGYLADCFTLDKKFLSEPLLIPPLVLKQKSSELAFRIKNILSQLTDDKFAIVTNYHALAHLQFLKLDKQLSFMNFEEVACHKNRVLLVHPNKSTFVNIRYTEKTNIEAIKKEFEYGCQDMKILAAINKDHTKNSSFKLINVVVAPAFVKVEHETMCKDCLLLDQKILSSDTKMLDFFSGFINTSIVTNTCIKEQFMDILSNITCFMATRKALYEVVPKLCDDTHEKVTSLFLTSQQYRILYHRSTKKIITGPLGSGKTIEALCHLQMVYELSQKPTVIYYIIWNQQTTMLQNVKNHAKKFNDNESVKVIITNIVELSKELNFLRVPTLSQLLPILLKENKGKQLHLVADEVDGEMFDLREATSLKQYFQKEENIQESAVIIFPQSIEKHRRFVSPEKVVEHSKYKYKETGMKVHRLNKAMRVSKCNFKFQKAFEAKLSELETIFNHPASEADAKISLPTVSARVEKVNVTEKQSNVDEHSEDSPKVETMHKTLDFELPTDIDVIAARLDDTMSDIKTVTKHKCNSADMMGHSIEGTKPVLLHFNEEPKTKDDLIVMLSLALQNECLHRRDVKRFILHNDDEQLNVFRMIFGILKVSYFIYNASTNWQIMKHDGTVVESLPEDEKYSLMTNVEGSRGAEAAECILMVSKDDCKLRHLTAECMARATSNLILVSTVNINDTQIKNSSTGHIIKQLLPNYLKEVCLKKIEDPNDENSCSVDQINESIRYVNVNSWRYEHFTEKLQNIKDNFTASTSSHVHDTSVLKDLQLPEMVGNVTCSYSTDTSCVLRWMNNGFTYLVRKENNKNSWIDIDSDILSGEYHINNLVLGETYKFGVAAVNRTGQSDLCVVSYSHKLNDDSKKSFTFYEIEQLIAGANIDEMKKIVSANRNVIFMKDRQGETLLMKAVRFNNLSIVKIIVENGYDVWIGNNNKQNAYHICAMIDRPTLLDYFCQHDISNINSEDKYNNTPLYWAAFYGNIECVQLLLRCHADVTVESMIGGSAHDVAAGRNKEEIRKMIFEYLNSKKNLSKPERNMLHKIQKYHT